MQAPSPSKLSEMKLRSEALLAEEKVMKEREKAVMVLVLRHLIDHGYARSAEVLRQESGVSLERIDVADNVSLLSVVQEFEAYFELRFRRKPKLTRKGSGADGTHPYGAAIKVTPTILRNTVPLPRLEVTPPPLPPSLTGPVRSRHKNTESPVSRNPGDGTTDSAPVEDSTGMEAGIVGTAINVAPRFGGRRVKVAEDAPPPPASEDLYEGRLLRPLPYHGDNEMRELASIISRDIIMENPTVHWNDIAGLVEAKALLKEAVVMPLKYPQFFTGILSPWKGVLLFGPPGTGKTMLAKALATECHTTFFNISASTIVSKWRGDSEKLVRVMFELARYHAPSTIFLDELDALMGQRDASVGEHEASRRMKTELLIQMDGLAKTAEHVFVLAASNLPWELDTAMLRRLEKRIYIPLPSVEGRECIIRSLLPPSQCCDLDYSSIALNTEGYSGSDIFLVCKESAMRPLRRVMHTLENEQLTDEEIDAIKIDPVSTNDVQAALMSTKPSAKNFADRYRAWSDEFAAAL